MPTQLVPVRYTTVYQPHIERVILVRIASGRWTRSTFPVELRDSVRSIWIPDGIVVIGNYTFEPRGWESREYENLRRVEFPASLEVIGREAFRSCTFGGHVELGHTQLRVIGKAAFANTCGMSFTLGLPQSRPVSIEDSAFDGSQIRGVLSLCTRDITSCAFRECRFLTRIDICSPDDLKLGEYAICDCVCVQTITLRAQRVVFDYSSHHCAAIGNCRALQTVVFDAKEIIRLWYCDGLLFHRTCPPLTLDVPSRNVCLLGQIVACLPPNIAPQIERRIAHIILSKVTLAIHIAAQRRRVPRLPFEVITMIVSFVVPPSKSL